MVPAEPWETLVLTAEIDHWAEGRDRTYAVCGDDVCSRDLDGAYPEGPSRGSGLNCTNDSNNSNTHVLCSLHHLSWGRFV